MYIPTECECQNFTSVVLQYPNKIILRSRKVCCVGRRLGQVRSGGFHKIVINYNCTGTGRRKPLQ